MWFKLTYSLASMYLMRPQDAPVSVPYPADEGEVTLWMRTFDTGNIPPQLCCSAILERSLRPKMEIMFQSLSDGVLPQDDPPTVELPYQLSHDAVIDASGRLPSKWAVPLKIMPQSFQDISGQMLERLTDSVRSFVKTLRWAQAASGTQSPFAFVGYEWSSDKVSWHAMPHSISVRIG